MRPAVFLLSVSLLAAVTNARRALSPFMLCRKYPNPPCGDGWRRISANSCAKYIHVHFSFSQAEERCRSMGGDLVSIHSEDEQHNMLCLSWRARAFQRSVWIGARKSEGEFRFTDGSKIDYNGWHRGAPGAAGDCVEADFLRNGRWNVVPCWKTRNFVCAKKM